MRKFFRTTLAFGICSLVIFSFVYAEQIYRHKEMKYKIK